MLSKHGQNPLLEGDVTRRVAAVHGPNLTPLMRTQKFVELDARAAE